MDRPLLNGSDDDSSSSEEESQGASSPSWQAFHRFLYVIQELDEEPENPQSEATPGPSSPKPDVSRFRHPGGDGLDSSAEAKAPPELWKQETPPAGTSPTCTSNAKVEESGESAQALQVAQTSRGEMGQGLPITQRYVRVSRIAANFSTPMVGRVISSTGISAALRTAETTAATTSKDIDPMEGEPNKTDDSKKDDDTEDNSKEDCTIGEDSEGDGTSEHDSNGGYTTEEDFNEDCTLDEDNGEDDTLTDDSDDDDTIEDNHGEDDSKEIVSKDLSQESDSKEDDSQKN